MSVTDTSRKRAGWQLLLVVGAVVVLLLVLVAPAAALVDRDYISGLVYLDANENGVWDPGEEGYAGEYGVLKEGDDWVWRHRGTTVTFTSIGGGPNDPFVVESAPTRDMEDHESDGDICTRQDLEKSLDEGYTAERPCEGTFGMISWADDITWEVTIVVPEGYKLTSDSTLQFRSGEEVPACDFGIISVGG
jgi:hypothetical protein